MTTLVWHDGHVHDGAAPLVSGLDRGLLLGAGVFTTCALIGGRPFALRRHLARLTRDAAALGLPALPVRDVHAGVTALAARTGAVEGRLRITWTAGTGGTGTLLVAATPGGPGHPDPAQHAVVLPWPHNERSPLSGIKSTSFGANTYGLVQARALGAHEGLLANTRGELCEGTTSNVLLERNDEVLTPPLSSGCLPGITRELLLQWAPQAGIPLREHVLTAEDVATAPHAALTSSLRGVMPLASIERRTMSTGPLTRALAELYTERRSADPDP